MNSHKQLLLANRAWAQEKLDLRADYFQRNQRAQQPEFLWIGCSDSRVPAEEITCTEPGELFVHRNIANLVIHTDFNILSVLQYAVEVLGVKHIIICGHYGCGGVAAAMTNKNYGLINKWLRHIKDVYRFHMPELDGIEDIEQRKRRLVELNVLEQAHNLAETTIVQQTWHKHQRPAIHGWVYEMTTGLIKELVNIVPNQALEPIYTYDFGPEQKEPEPTVAPTPNAFEVRTESSSSGKSSVADSMPDSRILGGDALKNEKKAN